MSTWLIKSSTVSSAPVKCEILRDFVGLFGSATLPTIPARRATWAVRLVMAWSAIMLTAGAGVGGTCCGTGWVWVGVTVACASWCSNCWTTGDGVWWVGCVVCVGVWVPVLSCSESEASASSWYWPWVEGPDSGSKGLGPKNSSWSSGSDSVISCSDKSDSSCS